MIGSCGPLAPQGAQEGQPGARSPALARVFAAWRAREERVKSFHITWECRLSFPKGYVSPNSGPLVGGLRAPDIEMAESDTYTFPPSSYLCEGKDRIRGEHVEVGCNGPKDWKQQARGRAPVEGRPRASL